MSDAVKQAALDYAESLVRYHQAPDEVSKRAAYSEVFMKQEWLNTVAREQQ